ncbi:MAG: alpha-amylase family glycosyl hydrolase [bacterium]
MILDPLGQKTSLAPGTPLKAESPPRTQPGEEQKPLPEEKVTLGAAPLQSTYRERLKAVNVYTSPEDELRLHDGFDSARDIVGLHASEGKPDEPYRFRIDVAYLKSGAELGNLDAYLLVSAGKPGSSKLPDSLPGESQPWNIAVKAYDQKNYAVTDEQGALRNNALRDLKFNSLDKCIEFSLDKEVLRNRGWKDGEALSLQAFTTKDKIGQVTDSLDSPASKPWEKKDSLTYSLSTGQDKNQPVQGSPWKKDIVYFVLTDRFADGDKTNNMDVNKQDPRSYHGGDLEGIIKNLDYVKGLGASTIWISPTMKNQTTFIDSQGYHGYWPVDQYQMDPHQGDMNKMKELVSKAHEKGLKVILDLPLNHVAWDHPWAKDPAKQNWLHHIGDIKDWNDPWQVENGNMYGLPDLAQENPEVSKYLIDMSKSWIDNTGIDGFRLDAVKHVPHSFWKQFDQAIREHAGPGFMLVGEDMDGRPSHLASYQKDGMSSLFDVPLYFTIKDCFAYDGSMRNLANRLSEADRVYENPDAMSVFLDNHDTARFLTDAGGNKDKLRLALAFMMTTNRIPTVYYGTEAGMEGRLEQAGQCGPENRKDMEWDKNPDLLRYFQKLTSIRNEQAPLQRGANLEMWQDDQVYAYDRKYLNDEVIVALNNGNQGSSRSIPLRAESEIKNGTTLENLLRPGDEVVVQNGRINVDMNSREAKIYVVKK